MKRIRILTWLVIVGLVLSGLTALALESEVPWLTTALGAGPESRPADTTGLLRWLVTVRDAIVETDARYRFMAYGTDWLAFAHLVIAVAFVGVLRDPLRNAWIVDFGLIGCAGVPLLALIAGEVRGIPWLWRLIDCSFGVACAIPLLLIRREIGRLRAGEWG